VVGVVIGGLLGRDPRARNDLDVGRHLLPQRRRVAAVDDGRLGDAPELPHRTHLGDARHRHSLSADLTEARGQRVCGDSGLEGCGEGRGAPADLVERGLHFFAAEVVHEELVGREAVLALGAQEEALDAGEGLSGLATGRRDRVDGEVDARLFGCGNVPRTGEEEGRVARSEVLDGEVTGDVRVEHAGGTLLAQPLGERLAAFVADLQVVGVVRAVFVGAEDGSAERRLERVEVVRVGGLGVETDQERVLGARLFAHRDHVCEVGRRLGREVGVAQERDVLDGVRDGVGLAVVGPGVDRDLLELGGLVAELDRGDDAVGDEHAEPVVRTDGHIGALAGRNLLDELVADLAELLLHEVDLDAGGLGEVGGGLFEDACAVRVHPDGDLAREVGGRGFGLAAAVTGAGRAAGERERGNSGDRAEGDDAPLVHLHWCVPLLNACIRTLGPVGT
jgi:hypothetical protein